MPHTEAAALTRPNASLTDGRRVRSVFQQSSRSFQTPSERPNSNASAGFDGFPPPKTLTTTSDPDSLANGGVPVSTYTARFGKCMHFASRGTHLVDYHSNRVYVSLLRRRAVIQSESRWNEEFRCHELGGPSAHLGLRGVHIQAGIIHDGHEPEVCKACRDGVGIRD